MRIDKKLKFLFFAACLSIGMTIIRGNSITEKQSEGRILSRQKRYLIFPQGSNVQLVFCLTIGSFPRPTELVIGLTAALAWELPNKIDEKIGKLLHRQSRSIIFPKIEAFLQSIGLDGKSCVLKAICEASKRKQEDIGKGTFVQELLHAIFRLRHDDTKFDRPDHQSYDLAHETTDECSKLYPNCLHSIYELEF